MAWPSPCRGVRPADGLAGIARASLCRSIAVHEFPDVVPLLRAVRLRDQPVDDLALGKAVGLPESIPLHEADLAPDPAIDRRALDAVDGDEYLLESADPVHDAGRQEETLAGRQSREESDFRGRIRRASLRDVWLHRAVQVRDGCA